MGYQTEEEKINEEFSEIIRDKLTEKQFWEFISSWKDAEFLCEEMEDWDIFTKKNTIEELKKEFKLK